MTKIRYCGALAPAVLHFAVEENCMKCAYPHARGHDIAVFRFVLLVVQIGESFYRSGESGVFGYIFNPAPGMPNLAAILKP